MWNRIGLAAALALSGCIDIDIAIGSPDMAEGGGDMMVPASCKDGVKNGSETDVDCGGDCGGCPVGKACAESSDCHAGVCGGGACAYPASCLALHDARPALASAVYTIDPDGAGGADPFAAYCEMREDDGGWTLALKMDGSAQTFAYDSELWTTAKLLNPSKPDLDRGEAKLQTYNSVPVHALRLGMIDGGTTRWQVVDVAGDSLHALVAPGTYVKIDAGLDVWGALLASPSLQTECLRAGLDSFGDSIDKPELNVARVRIGIIANNEPHCLTPDSWIGFGGGGVKSKVTVGNVANGSWFPDHGARDNATFGYVMVR